MSASIIDNEEFGWIRSTGFLVSLYNGRAFSDDAGMTIRYIRHFDSGFAAGLPTATREDFLRLPLMLK